MRELSITQTAAAVTAAQVDKFETWLLVTAADMPVSVWRQLPYGALIRARARRRAGRGAWHYRMQADVAARRRRQCRPETAALKRAGMTCPEARA